MPLPASVQPPPIFEMANTQSAAKRARQSSKRALRNRSVLNRLRTLQKSMRAGDKIGADQARELISAIDKAAKRGIIHRNAARRRKLRLNRLIAPASAKRA
jgi:small subunit ribosomal protein S20